MKKALEAVCVTSEGIDRQQIVFDSETGLILQVGDLSISENRLDYIFSDECFLFAGMGDVHIHAREDVSGKNNYKEDFVTASKAALNGGVVHAADMPNNPIPPIDDDSYMAKAALTEKGLIPFLLYAGIGPQTKPLSFEVPYKAYMGPSVGDLFFEDHATLDRALENYKERWVSFHCEDPKILEENKDHERHYQRRPIEAEVLATEQACELIKKYNLRGKICHFSATEGLKAIKKARAEGAHIQCEATPQHLFFSHDEFNCNEHTKYQMNPPIRSEKERRELLEALKNGDIDFLATDHAPHTKEEKLAGTSGLTGLDTFAPFVSWLILSQDISPERIAKICCENPGDFFNQFLPTLQQKLPWLNRYGQGMGYLRPGYSASFTVINMAESVQIDPISLQTKVGHSPFDEYVFPGRLETCFLRGKRIRWT